MLAQICQRPFAHHMRRVADDEHILSGDSQKGERARGGEAQLIGTHRGRAPDLGDEPEQDKAGSCTEPS